MNKVLSKIAGVQLKALRMIKENPKAIEDHPLYTLLQVQMEEIKSCIDQEIELYEKIQENPMNIVLLNPYQIGICSFILFRMELEWILDNPDDVVDAWQKLDNSFQMQSLIYAN